MDNLIDKEGSELTEEFKAAIVDTDLIVKEPIFR